MRHFFVGIFVLMLTSCEYFNVKKTSSEAILNEELQAFNWNDVDEYPSFSECDSLSVKEDRKGCFQSVLTLHIWEFLKNERLVVSQDINDTLLLKFQATKEGDIYMLEAEMDSITSQEIPNIKSLLKKSLDSLPEIFPAIKRGQQVTTEFNLPIIINVN
ncbi:hypothetical protein MBM09_03685 [Flaviramulus sp. BrNp1-15]|uniref:hypothetical protein n=1 Tax=Flaviramulus sp. BrNp1-15 TaxID=2916754 RepID=UPI001EE90970|nr:hypothetical protein [Flaviramulus sp. BrNp1-15]ULC60092.1 hypothetical protein MBM09_03685 [Flaviramulus sp. BrNp1-15]